MTLSVAMAALLAGGAPSDDAEDREKTPASDVIVVTGERVRRSIKDTAASVEVFDSRRLPLEPGVDRLEDLFDSIPNVQSGSEAQGPTIRGQDSTGVLVDLAAFLGGNRPRMTLNIDGRAATYNEFVTGVAPLWDVEQVEVFRSPQSIVEGRNSIAGATYIRTRSPTWDWQAGARALTDNRGGMQGSLMVSGPIAGDQLAARLAADWRRAKPSSWLADTMNGADPNHDDYGWARFKLLATPAALPGSRLELSIQHLRSKAPQTVSVREPFERRRDPSPGYGVFANRITSATLRAEVPFSDSLSSHAILALGESSVRRFAPIGRGEARNRVADRSLEFRLDWLASPRLRMRGGVHALWTSLDQKIDLSQIIGIGAFEDRQDALGLFGEVQWRPAPPLTLTASLRYQRDHQDRQGAIVGSGLTRVVDFDRVFTFVLPKLAIDWDVTGDIRVGAMLQRGSAPGGTSINFATGEPELVDAESLWNAEVYARASLADGRLTLSANLFRNAHRDAQRALPRIFAFPGQPALTWFELYNLPRARSEGVEASVEWRPVPQLTVRASGGLLRTQILEASDDAPQFEGRQFARAPRRSAALGLDWRPLDQLSLSARLRHASTYFSDDLNTASRRIEGGSEIDGRLSYRTGKFTIFGYGRNLTDRFALRQLTTATSGAANKPRELGIGLETAF